MVINNGKLTRVSEEDIVNGSLQIPSEVIRIDDYAFRGLNNLKTIELPDTIVSVGRGAFSNCSSLENVKLSNSLTIIYPEVFLNCRKLKSVNIPDSVVKISKNAFDNCLSLENLVIPESVSTIEQYAFYHCDSISEMVLPQNVLEIGDGAFQDCISLKNVTLPDKLKSIKQSLFANCFSLENVNIPKELFALNEGAFFGCKKLKSAVFSDNFSILGKNAFFGCESLENVSISSKIEEIPDSAFLGCKNLKEFNVPDSVQKIGESSFENCEGLDKFIFSDNIKTIGRKAFSGCKNIKISYLPKNLEKIGDKAFYDCKEIKSIDFPQTLKFVGNDAFSECSSLENLSMPADIKKFLIPKGTNMSFFARTDDNLLFTTSQYPDSIPLENLGIDIAFLNRNWDFKSKIIGEQKNSMVCDFYNKFVCNQGDEFERNFVNNHNFTFFKQLHLDTQNNDYSNLYKFFYNLGVFEPCKEENGKKIDMAQKVVGFLQEKIRKNEFDIDKLNIKFENIAVVGFNSDFTEFFINHFDEIMEEQRYDPDFISMCCNNFIEVQKTNTSNKGSQRQLKATVQKFKEFFAKNKFDGVDEDTIEIAKTIAPFFSSQQTFRWAVKIENERISRGVPSNILSKHLSEKDMFKSIDEYSKKILELQSEFLGVMADIADNEFTFDWLEKNDPDNLILGKYCSCCAHLEGAGFGIMRAGIMHPNVQNLVIRNGKGEIIAKSTLYISRKNGYGVFNNVEVSHRVPDDVKDKIYQKYILGVKAFAQQYNIENPDAPLKQINVGMHVNDLENLLRENNEKADELLDSLDYSYYGIDHDNYNGDSEFEQYIVWRNPNISVDEKIQDCNSKNEPEK